MENPPAVIKSNFWILAIILVAIVAGGVAVWQIEPWTNEGQRLPERFEYDLDAYKKTDPALIHYRETRAFPVMLDRPRAIAAGPEDQIYVAGDTAIVVFDANGSKLRQIDLEHAPRCLAVIAEPETSARLIYVGMTKHVEVYDAEGSRRAVWKPLGEKAMLTSIAAAEADVFVADAGSRVVWHCDASGNVVKQIGKRDDDRNIRGFVIPSPYFDVAVSPDGLVRVANPGAHRVEGYTVDGDLEVVWGKASLAIDGFCGCCNPANFTILPDGSFVTVEKGLPRVKVYDPEGRFVAVVAGPEHLVPTPTMTEETRVDYKLAVFDVAADRQGRVLLLDPAGRVRVFQRRPPSKATTTENDDA